MSAQLGMSEIEPLPLIVVVDKEAHRPLQGLQRAAETATPAGQALEIGAQIGIQAFHRVGFFLAYRDQMLAVFGPDHFLIGGMPIAGVMGSPGQGIYHAL